MNNSVWLLLALYIVIRIHKSTLNYEFTMYVSYVLLCVVDAIYVDKAILIRANRCTIYIEKP